MTTTFYDQSFPDDKARRKAWSQYVAASRKKNKQYFQNYNKIYICKKSFVKFKNQMDELYKELEDADEKESIKLKKKLIVKQRYFYKCFLRMQDLDILPSENIDNKYKGSYNDILKLPTNISPDAEYQFFLDY